MDFLHLVKVPTLNRKAHRAALVRGRIPISKIGDSRNAYPAANRMARYLIAPVAVAAIGGMAPVMAPVMAQTAATSSPQAVPAASSSSASSPVPTGTVTQALPPPAATEQKEPDRSTDAQKPIISDDDFTAALPPLEDTVAPASPATPAPDAQTLQAATDSALDAPLPPVATPDDPELTAALPPIDGYDVMAVKDTGPEPATPPQLSYTTSVDGLAEIGQYDRFKTLSALHGGKGKAANIAMIRARTTEDQSLALRLMKSVGYFDGTVSATISSPAGGGSPVDAHIVAVPGQAYRLGTVVIDAQPTIPPDLIRSSLPVRVGDIIVADQVLAAEANVSLVLPQRGYPFANVLGRDIALDPKTGVGDYTLKVDVGNRAKFGAFTTSGKLAFDARHVAVLKRFNAGDLYDSRKVDDLRQALISTGLFSTVAVSPVRTGKIDGDGVETVDLAVTQQAGRPRTLAAEAGYSTGQGFSLTGSWTHRNLFPPEGALILGSTIGTQEQGITATFRRSNDQIRDRTFTAAVTADHSIYDTYTAYTTGFSASWARVSTPIWQKEWTWSYGAELLASRERATVIGTTTTQAETYYLANIPLKLGYDRSNDLLNPSTGYRLGVQGVPQISLSGSGASSVRAIFDASYYYPVGARLVVATRARFGSLLGGRTQTIAPSRRLYAGGGGSVRGYAYQGLGPLDADNNPTGGLSLFEASVEGRYRFGDYGIVPFIDMGQVYSSNIPQFSDLRVGVGVGARLYTNFGPIRIDVATPLSRRKNEPAIALYVGIGQAF